MFQIIASQGEEAILTVGPFEERPEAERALVVLCGTPVVEKVDSVQIIDEDEEDEDD